MEKCLTTVIRGYYLLIWFNLKLGSANTQQTLESNHAKWSDQPLSTCKFMLRTDVTLCLLNVFTLVQLIYSYNWDIFLRTVTNKVNFFNKFYLSITTSNTTYSTLKNFSNAKTVSFGHSCWAKLLCYSRGFQRRIWNGIYEYKTRTKYNLKLKKNLE